MREWPQCGTTDHSTGHVIRYLPRDYKIFRLMEEGWQYPEVWRFVEAKRQQMMNMRWKSGENNSAESSKTQESTREANTSGPRTGATLTQLRCCRARGASHDLCIFERNIASQASHAEVRIARWR